jgi:starvation-inducible DNA-binding protein
MPHTEPSAVIVHLRREQANAVELYLQYKGYHWNVAGPLFRELHLLFDEHAGQVFEMIDALAERERMLGAPAPYTLEEIRQYATLPAERSLPGTPREMLTRLLHAHRIVIDGMHAGFRAAESAGDPGSADLFARFVQAHQKMEWFLREQAHERVTVPETEESRAVKVAEPGGLGPTATWIHPAGAIPEHPLP